MWAWIGKIAGMGLSSSHIAAAIIVGVVALTATAYTYGHKHADNACQAADTERQIEVNRQLARMQETWEAEIARAKAEARELMAARDAEIGELNRRIWQQLREFEDAKKQDAGLAEWADTGLPDYVSERLHELGTGGG